MAEYKLSKPIEINGELTEKITYDLDDLTGNDVSMAIRELGKKGIIVTMNETDQNYHAMLFAISAGLDFEDIKMLKIKDFTKVCNLVRDFFLNDSEE